MRERCLTYVRFPERKWQQRPTPPPAPRIVRGTVDPREALANAVREAGESLAALSRMIGRDSSYLGRFVAYGVPRMLTEADHNALAAFFGKRPWQLGVRDLWSDRAAA